MTAIESSGPFYVVIREGTGDGEVPSFVLGVFTDEDQAEEVRHAYGGGQNAVIGCVPRINEVVLHGDARFWGF